MASRNFKLNFDTDDDDDENNDFVLTNKDATSADKVSLDLKSSG